MAIYLLDFQPELHRVLRRTVDDGQSADVTHYLHTLGGLHRQQQPDGSWVHPLTDGLGSVRSVLSDALTPLHSQHYAPYGEVFDAAGTNQTMFNFTGEPLDANGLLYLRARYYRPELGVFPSLDPVEGSLQDILALNRYGYVAGNVVNMVDPSGMIYDLPPSPCEVWPSQSDGCQNANSCDGCVACYLDTWPYRGPFAPINAAYEECRKAGKCNAFTQVPTPTLSISFPTQDLLTSPTAQLPYLPVSDMCVEGSTEGTHRRACAAQAYNAIWQQLNGMMTWDDFFAITLQGEAGVLYSGVSIVECGTPDGRKLQGHANCQPIVENEILPLLERALIRQIYEVCGQDGCTEDELLTLMGGFPVPASDQTLGIEAWYNAGRASGTPDTRRLLGGASWQRRQGHLDDWTTTPNLRNGCSGLACSWGNCTSQPVLDGLAWVIYEGGGDYTLPSGNALFIVGRPISGTCR